MQKNLLCQRTHIDSVKSEEASLDVTYCAHMLPEEASRTVPSAQGGGQLPDVGSLLPAREKRNVVQTINVQNESRAEGTPCRSGQQNRRANCVR